MIETIITHHCRTCGSKEMVKNGHDYKGAQKYHCRNCGRCGTLQPQRGYGKVVRAQVKQAVLERLSLRGIERLLGVSRRTVSPWLVGWMEQQPALSSSLLPAQLDDILELDELWSFVGSETQERWLWLALCRRTRQVRRLLDRRSFGNQRHSTLAAIARRLCPRCVFQRPMVGLSPRLRPSLASNGD